LPFISDGQITNREGHALPMDPARALTAFYRVDTARWIVDNARKTDATLTLGSRRLGFAAL